MPDYKNWIERLDINIDYYSAFIKAWIAFNSWYHSEYSGKDREIIEKIKYEDNRFRSYIEAYLDKNNEKDEAVKFRYNLSKLQTSLADSPITTQERSGVKKQISFSDIAITNPKTFSKGNYRNTNYRVERKGQIVTTVVSKKNDLTTKHFEFSQDKYDETALDIHSDFKKLSSEQQGQCKAFYREVSPYTSESVIDRDSDGNVIFITERIKVSRGIVEVLYLLRCSLMHGDVFPDSSSSEVYKYAYYVLLAILKKLL